MSKENKEEKNIAISKPHATFPPSCIPFFITANAEFKFFSWLTSAFLFSFSFPELDFTLI